MREKPENSVTCVTSCHQKQAARSSEVDKVKLLTIKQTAEQLQVSGQTIGRMIAEGTLPAILLRSGKRKKAWRIREEVLERWLLQHEKQTAQEGTVRRKNLNSGNHENERSDHV